MSRLVIVVEKLSDWGSYYPSDNVVAATDYLKEAVGGGDDDERTQVINLCRSYKYLGTGYYVSLLAEARGHKVIPRCAPSTTCAGARCTVSISRTSTQQLASSCRTIRAMPPISACWCTSARRRYAPLADLARQVFEAFPCPILRLEFERQRVWQISAIKPTGLNTLSDSQEDAFARRWMRSRARPGASRARGAFRYDIAMLQDPAEAMPPSNRRALKHFIEAGKELGIEVDPITRNDFARLAEYDGLFIRETTAIGNHTYRFATAPSAKAWW
jgi:hypothetical protein